MKRTAVEQQRVSDTEIICLRAVTVFYLPFEHIDKFDTAVAETRMSSRLILERDKIRLDHHVPAKRMTQKLVDMADLRPPPVNGETLTRRNKRTILPVFERGKKIGQGYLKYA